MKWLSENWVWLLFAVAFIAAHMFGHGGHGGHGRGGSGGRHRHGRVEHPTDAGRSGDAPQHRH